MSEAAVELNVPDKPLVPAADPEEAAMQAHGDAHHHERVHEDVYDQSQGLLTAVVRVPLVSKLAQTSVFGDGLPLSEELPPCSTIKSDVSTTSATR